MTRQAILLNEEIKTNEQLRIARILNFFGVSWESADPQTASLGDKLKNSAIFFGSAPAAARALAQMRSEGGTIASGTAFYVYLGPDRGENESALRSIIGSEEIFLQAGRKEILRLTVSRNFAELSGPMTGIEVAASFRSEDNILAGAKLENPETTTPIILAEGDPIFIRFQDRDTPVFISASSDIPDIDQTIRSGFYDVREHFCSAVPLVMFIRYIFREIAWGPRELGACLIIDDPLLKPRYGFCDFRVLRDLMLKHGFTTNIAFIPWNRRRTSRANAEFFRNEQRFFSVSIHGCDHTAGEFGSTSPLVLNNAAERAQVRMREHERRTGIHHDAVMVFPQGVFSSICPAVLKRNGYLAAVNTEIVPVDVNGTTTIKDVWDVAIMRFADFPIFTRRYAHHGLHNFAFDLLLGKPCLITSHHDFFKNGCAKAVELVQELHSLNCKLSWRPLGEVVRRACRQRINENGIEEIEAYGNEFLIANPSEQRIHVRIRKKENQKQFFDEVRSNGKSIASSLKEGEISFIEEIAPHSEKRIQYIYRDNTDMAPVHLSLRFKLSVAARRILSELRDEYVL